MLHFFVPTERSGRDVLSTGTIEALRDAGIGCALADLWSQRIYKLTNSGKFPWGRTIFRRFMAPFLAARQLAACRPGDIAWILSFCAPCVTEPTVERHLKRRGCKYVFHVMDDWFDFDWLRQGTIQRCQLADLVVVPTPQLEQRVKEFIPEAKVAVFEEPIDVDRLSPRQELHLPDTPVVLWCGNPYNLSHIGDALPVLHQIQKGTPFTLRVICGEKPPTEFMDGLNVQWRQFSHENERQLISGSWMGIAPMPDGGHNRCKGAYKIKTYCASGLPVVASPIGFQADLVREGNGIGFLPETPGEWVQALTRLLASRTLCLELGQRARAYAERRFSYGAVAPQWARKLRESFSPRALQECDTETQRSH